MKTKSKTLRIHDKGGRKMKNAKKPMALFLSLVLCMGLSACGNDPPKPPPDSFEGMVKESKIAEDRRRARRSL